MNVSQNGVKFVPSQTKVGFDKNQSNKTISINTSLEWEATSDQSWCTVSRNGNNLTIRVTAYGGSSASRKATISFKGLLSKIEVNQSKYAVGDEYNENGVKGEVAYMNDTVRYVKKEVGKSVWSTENVETGANDNYNGMKNMAVIKKISDWKNLYPAFALCDALNAEGVTGWYLPALFELERFASSSEYWNSTEDSYSLVWINNRYSAKYKNEITKVMAIHKF